MGNQDQSCAPHVCCTSCSSKHKAWVICKGCSMLFSVPMTRKEPTNYLKGCYFCILPPNQTVITNKKKLTVEYQNIQLTLCPVPCCEGLPIPECRESLYVDVMRKRRIYSKIHATYFKRVRIFPERNVYRTTQRHKELIRDLEWSNNNAELLPSRLQQWNRLDDTVKVTAFHSTE